MPRCLSAAALAAVLAAAATAAGQPAQYGPYYELEARGGGVTDDGQVSFFLPVRQDGASLLFADLRFQSDDKAGAQGAWGLAFRRQLDSGWIAGVNGYYDLRHTQSDLRFSQFGGGFEALNLTQGFRGNFYLPETGAKAVAPGDAANSAILVGNDLFLSRPREVAFRGFDLEAEQLLWWSGQTGPDAPAGQPTPDIGWWASAGAFHFSPTEGALEDLTGPRLRSEVRVYDLPMLGDDSRLVFGAQLEHDDTRGTTGTATITIRMALGRPPRRGRRLTWAEQRMVAPVVRERRILTDALTGAAGVLEPAINARIDRLITSARIIDATTADPNAEIAAAGVDSLVIVDGSSGNLTLGATPLAVGQVLLGGRAGIAIRGAETGAVATFFAPGTQPTIDFGASEGLSVADDTTVVGMTLQGANDDGAGFDSVVTATDATNVLFGGVSIEAVSLNPLGAPTNPVTASGAAEVRFEGSVLTGGQSGLVALDTAEVAVARSGVFAVDNAISAADQSAVDVSEGTIAFSNLTTARVADDALLSIDASRIEVAQSSPFLEPVAVESLDDSRLEITSSRIAASDPSVGAVRGGRGVVFSGDAMIIESSTFTTTDHGVQIIAPGNDTHTLLIAGSSFTSQEAPSISYTGLAGSAATINATIVNNTLNQDLVSQFVADTATSGDEFNLSLAGNSILNRFGTITIEGNIDVTQDAPMSNEEGIDIQNGIPASQVNRLGAIEFLQPDPITP